MGRRSRHPENEGRRVKDKRQETRLVEAGRRAEWTQGLVNPAVWRASTILFDSVADMKASKPAPSSRSRASPAFTNWPLAIQSPFKVTYISPVAIDLTIASSRFAAMRASIFCGSVRFRTVMSCCGAPSRSEMRWSS